MVTKIKLFNFRMPKNFWKKLKNFQNQKGQALLEFLLIMGMLYLLALSMLKITNNGLAKIWQVMVTTITKTPVQLR